MAPTSSSNLDLYSINITAKLEQSVLIVKDFTEELFDAIGQNDFESVRECLALGANIYSNYDRDILSAALAWPEEKNYQIVEYLIEAGANPNIRSSDGTTALYWATVAKDESLVRRFIKIGANVEFEEPEDGYSSIHAAAEDGNTEILKLLLPAGGKSKLNTFDYIARTPLMCAVKSRSIDVALLLIKAGADLDANDVNRIGDTALTKAVEQGHVEMVRVLIEANADPTIEGWMRMTPLAKAQIIAENSSDEILQLLLAKLSSLR